MIGISSANWDRVNLYLTIEKDFINEAYLLDKNNINYVCISGDYQERYEQSKEKVKQLIGRK